MNPRLPRLRYMPAELMHNGIAAWVCYSKNKFGFGPTPGTAYVLWWWKLV